MSHLDAVVKVSEVRGGRTLDDSWSGREICSVIVGWVTSLALWFMIGVWIACATNKESGSALCTNYFRKKALFWSLFSVNYLIYLINALTRPTRQYLSNQLEEPCSNFIARLMTSPPILTWHIQCYHYETRTRTVTDSKGHTRTETYTVRVDTHSASGAYSIASWRDTSSRVDVPMTPNLLRMRLEKTYKFADAATAADYASKFGSWVAANDRDTHKDVSEGFEISGFESYVLSRPRNESSICNCFISSVWFYIFTLLTLNSLYSQIFICITTPFDVNLEKEINCRPNAYSSIYVQPPAEYAQPTVNYELPPTGQPLYGDTAAGYPPPPSKDYPPTAPYPQTSV